MVLVVEDLISTGGSVISVAEALRDAGADVIGVVSIFTYGLKRANVAFEEAGLKHTSLTDFDAACEAAAETGYIAAGDIEQLKQFRNSL